MCPESNTPTCGVSPLANRWRKSVMYLLTWHYAGYMADGRRSHCNHGSLYVMCITRYRFATNMFAGYGFRQLSMGYAPEKLGDIGSFGCRIGSNGELVTIFVFNGHSFQLWKRFLAWRILER